MATAFLLVFAMVCYGWGRLVGKLYPRNEQAPLALDITLGLAALSAVGGVLNALHLAVPMALHILCAIGGALAVFFIAATVRRPGGIGPLLNRPAEQSAKNRSFAGLLPNLLPAALVLVMTGFFAWTLLPAGALNIHDDFHTYLVRPVRMLATGSVGGNPF